MKEKIKTTPLGNDESNGLEEEPNTCCLTLYRFQKQWLRKEPL